MLHSLNTDIQAPERFTYPFCYEPHPLCEMAAKEVQAYIGSHMEIREDADNGKMFGVLQPIADCWQVVMTGRSLCLPFMMPNSLTDTSRLQSGRSLSFLITRLS